MAHENTDEMPFEFFGDCTDAWDWLAEPDADCVAIDTPNGVAFMPLELFRPEGLDL